MEVRDGSNVPGITGQGACAETAYVVGKIGDDHFDEFERKSGGGRSLEKDPLNTATRLMPEPDTKCN